MDEGRLEGTGYRRVLVHMVEDEMSLSALGASSKMNTEHEFLDMLFAKGPASDGALACGAFRRARRTFDRQHPRSVPGRRRCAGRRSASHATPASAERASLQPDAQENHHATHPQPDDRHLCVVALHRLRICAIAVLQVDGSEESIFIFATLRDWSGIGLFEPFGRFFIGFCELVASILLFMPRTRIWGAGMALVIISGAIFFHLFTPLGVEIKGDGGLLFTLACGVWISSAAILWIERTKVAALLSFLRGLVGRPQPMRM